LYLIAITDPDRAFGEQQADKNSFPQIPFLFARLLKLRPIFWRDFKNKGGG